MVLYGRTQEHNIVVTISWKEVCVCLSVGVGRPNNVSKVRVRV